MEIYIPQVPNNGGDNNIGNDAYTVQPGDTLESIADQFGVSVKDLIAANSSDGTLPQLSAGQELQIPLGDNLKAILSYTVQEGDTNASIANENQITPQDLLRANPQLIKLALYPGLNIKVPQFGDKEQITNKLPESYTLKLGDTLAELSKKHGLSLTSLSKANPQLDVHKSYPGTTIKFPIEQKVEHKPTSNETNANISRGVSLDSFSKLRFQMMDNMRPVLREAPLPPTFGTAINQAPDPDEDELPQRANKNDKRLPVPPPFDKWADLIYAAATKYRIDASLIAAVIWCESGGNNIIGKNGHGCGLMQIDDRRYSNWLRDHQQGLDPETNIDFGVSLLRDFLNHFEEALPAALAAYHSGIDAVAAAMRSPEIFNSSPGNRYAFDVMAQQDYFKKFFED